MAEIFDLLSEIHAKVFGSPLEMRMADINSQESMEKFKLKLE